MNLYNKFLKDTFINSNLQGYFVIDKGYYLTHNYDRKKI